MGVLEIETSSILDTESIPIEVEVDVVVIAKVDDGHRCVAAK